MRILIISDIHANLAAFKAVLADAEGQWDKVWFLGDLIGYGPDPNECVDLLQTLDHIALSGNHDWAVLNKLDITTFNAAARMAITLTRTSITDESRDFLDSLPPMVVEGQFTLAHASPRQPVWEYILDLDTAAANFDHFKTPYCLVGHTHVPVVFALDDEDNAVFPIMPDNKNPLLLDDARCIINPGSVGQPRDRDPRAAYALLDLDTLSWQYRRVAYPVHQTQEKMRQVGMPPRLVERLEFGW